MATELGAAWARSGPLLRPTSPGSSAPRSKAQEEGEKEATTGTEGAAWAIVCSGRTAQSATRRGAPARAQISYLSPALRAAACKRRLRPRPSGPAPRQRDGDEEGEASLSKELPLPAPAQHCAEPNGPSSARLHWLGQSRRCQLFPLRHHPEVPLHRQEGRGTPDHMFAAEFEKATSMGKKIKGLVLRSS
ncbi:hypothetical protein lerEdw1_002583 [Lerista edwardsae]|nr:hypothetical protein lerEdw1_002583 [Lerista edwardsae]